MFLSQHREGRTGGPAAHRALRRQGFPCRQTSAAGSAHTLQTKKNIHVLRVPAVVTARARPGAMSVQVVPKRMPAMVMAGCVETANYKDHNRKGAQKSAIPLSSPRLLVRKGCLRSKAPRERRQGSLKKRIRTLRTYARHRKRPLTTLSVTVTVTAASRGADRGRARSLAGPPAGDRPTLPPNTRQQKVQPRRDWCVGLRRQQKHLRWRRWKQ